MAVIVLPKEASPNNRLFMRIEMAMSVYNCIHGSQFTVSDKQTCYIAEKQKKARNLISTVVSSKFLNFFQINI